jgi:exopolyphosphatase/guanosine-5'-triphosphate,3'-diphosphate pyrophosphatase
MVEQLLRDVEQPSHPLELSPERLRRSDEEHFAVIDIGSNSVRLVVYDRLSRSPFPRFNEKSLCGLGQGLRETGELAAEAMDHTLQTMVRFAAICDAMDVSRVDVIATEAIRKASNGKQFVRRINATGSLKVRVLSGPEEATFSALGVVSGFYRAKGLVGDIGGGSLEIAEVANEQVGDRLVSLPLGALPVKAMLEAKGKSARREVDAVLKDQLPPSMLVAPVFYAVGGGWRALARVHMAMTQGPIGVSHGYEMEAAEVRELAKRISRLDEAAISALPNVPTRRVTTLAASALVMDRVLKHLAPQHVVFSSLGLREGWLYAQLPEDERRRDPLIEGVQAMALLNARVPEFAPALVRWTENLFLGEETTERRLRVAACALSDIAWRDQSCVLAHQSFERILRFPFIGITHPERAFLAATIHARYGRPAEDPALSLLTEQQRQRALILGLALSLGYRFSGSVPGILDQAHLRIETDAVRMIVDDTRRMPDSETVRSRLQRLAKAMGIEQTEVVYESAG